MSLPNIIALNSAGEFQKSEYVRISRLHNDISTWLLNSAFFLNCTIWRSAPPSVAAPQGHYSPWYPVFQHYFVAPDSEKQSHGRNGIALPASLPGGSEGAHLPGLSHINLQSAPQATESWIAGPAKRLNISSCHSLFSSHRSSIPNANSISSYPRLVEIYSTMTAIYSLGP